MFRKLIIPSCLVLGLKSTDVTVSLCPLKCRSSVGSSYKCQVFSINCCYSSDTELCEIIMY